MADVTQLASWCSARAVVLLDGDAFPVSLVASPIVLVSRSMALTDVGRAVDGVFSYGALQRVADCRVREKRQAV